ncbi:hypothetical protein MTO96_013547 [Rhipicephalus appendiculatus]
MSACWLGLTSQQQRVTTPEIEQRLQRVSGRPRAAQPRRTPDSPAAAGVDATQPRLWLNLKELSGITMGP